MPAYASETRRLFAANVHRRDDRVDLALAALLIAAEEYPGISIEEYLLKLDQLAAELQVEMAVDAAPEQLCRTLASFLAGTQEFRGNAEDYYDPRNSYLSQVIDRRTGIPITLAIVYIEVARRAGVTLLPISFPGHFLVKLPARDGDIFLDPFHGGRLLSAADCRALLERQFRDSIAFQEAMLGAATKRQVISRLLNNLRGIYLRAQDPEKALRTLEQMLTVTPWDLDLLRDRGILLYRLGRGEAAIEDLQTFVAHAPPGASVEAVKEALRRMT